MATDRAGNESHDTLKAATMRLRTYRTQEAPLRTFSKIVLLAVLLTGCAGARKGDDVPQELPVRFICTNGEAIDVRFYPARRVALLIRNETSVELTQQPAASGFVYSNGPNTIRGKGDDLRVEIGRMVPLECKVAP